jgi:putative membrane protein
MMIIGLLLFVFVIYLLFKQNGASVDVKTSDVKDALEIAKVRLAKGEINVEEFEMIKKSIM